MGYEVGTFGGLKIKECKAEMTFPVFSADSNLNQLRQKNRTNIHFTFVNREIFVHVNKS